MREQSWIRMSAIPAICLVGMLAACDSNDAIINFVPRRNAFAQTNLVADVSGTGATTIDSNLVNPWGIAFGPTGNLWVANNGTSTTTFYDASGKPAGTAISIPGSDPQSGGAPTGIVLNATNDFVIPGAGAATFLFAGEDGTIAAWNSSTTSAKLVVNRSSNGAVYKGIAIAVNGGANFLYATDFKNNRVEVFNGSFQLVNSFTDPNIPAGYAPFGIANLGGRLYVTFAKQKAPDNEDDEPGVGNGFVDVFNANGTVAMRFASNGHLNAPWAVVRAPANFGLFGNAVLVGNFGDGQIGVYNPTTGAFIDVLRDESANPIAIDGLWGLVFGPSSVSTTLYFAAGPDDESHGLVGTLTLR
jgi:uncharacterized protein (TIGR03118 family)